MKKCKRSALYLAAHEHELAVNAFADAMRLANPDFIARSEEVDFTMRMEECWLRYRAACRRLSEVNL